MKVLPYGDRVRSPARPPNSRVVIYLRTDQRRKLMRSALRSGLSTSYFVARELIRAGYIEP